MDKPGNSENEHGHGHDDHDGKDVVNFTVDGEKEETQEKKLTAAEILELVGLDPKSNYLVEVSPKEHSFKDEPTKEIVMKDGMVFKTKPTGPMPVSCN